ncbi:MAG: hypothetical protein HC800_00170 [Phormidesmis sp. RL_2_1]|nr:hypothetical protein [Phormidesmis sp. RL_2_1]
MTSKDKQNINLRQYAVNMSLVALLVVIWIALVFSNLADAFPGILWSWWHLPKGLLWLGLLALVAWCMDSESSG